jgi:hypothetical protein
VLQEKIHQKKNPRIIATTDLESDNRLILQKNIKPKP